MNTPAIPDNLEKLRAQLAEFAAVRNWDQFHSPKNLAMALVAECGELVEHFQWLTEEESCGLDPERLAKVRLELADIMIYLIRVADKLGVDLFQAATDKIAINEKRYPVELVHSRALRAEEYLENKGQN